MAEIKNRIAQTRAVLAVNAEMIQLYWQVGQLTAERQFQEGWGKGVIPRLEKDISNEFHEIKGFSARNLNRIVTFYVTNYKSGTILPQPVAKLPDGSNTPQAVAKETFADSLLWQIPWGHHALLVEKVKLYCNVVDDTLRHPQDAATIGLILCQGKDNVLAEYALRGISLPQDTHFSS